MSNNMPTPSDIKKIRNNLLKKYNVRSERELMQKLLGTSDKNEIRKILLNKLNGLPPNDPLAKIARNQLNNKKSSSSLSNELIESLTPEQRRQLKSLLKRQQKR